MDNLSEILKKMPQKNSSGTKSQTTTKQQNSYQCESCYGLGWYTYNVPVGHENFGKFINCTCQSIDLKTNLDRLLKKSNLSHVRKYKFETLVSADVFNNQSHIDLFTTAYKEAHNYAKNPVGWMVFTGPNGSGKTHLAAAIGNQLIDNGQPVTFFDVPELIDSFKRWFSNENNDSDTNHPFEQIKNSPLLILDDFKTGSTNTWSEEKLKQLIKYRSNRDLPTIYTISGSLNQLDHYILSRIQQKESCKILNLPAPTNHTFIQQKLGKIDQSMLNRMNLNNFNIQIPNATQKQKTNIKWALQAAKNFTKDPERWLTLIGDTGVGKTHLAVAIANDQIQKGVPVFFAFVPELLDYLRYTFSPTNPTTYDEIFENVKNSELLILDDLGREHTTPWAADKLYQIIVHRYNSRLPTVITAISDLNQIESPISSRIKDPSVSQLIEIDAPDYRNKERIH